LIYFIIDIGPLYSEMLLFNNIMIYIAASVMKTSTEHEVNGAIEAFLKYASDRRGVEEEKINVHAVY